MNRRTRALTIALCVAAIATASCAALLGIDDVKLKDAGADDASLLDVSAADARSDAPIGTDYESVVKIDSPIAYWKLDYVDGANAIDSSGHGLDATYAIEVIHGPSLISDDGGSAFFPGSPDAGEFGPGITLPRNKMLEVAGPITVEAWIRPLKATLSEVVTYGQQQVPPFQPWGLQYGPPAQFYTACCHGVDGVSPLLDTGVTYYLAATFDTFGGIILYVNGVFDNDGGVGGELGPYDGFTGLGIGSAASGALPFNGWIDEVAVYDKVLSPDRILAHYNAGK